MKNKTIEGSHPDRAICANLGSGFATYALVRGEWYSVNLNGEPAAYDSKIVDVRWKATEKELRTLNAPWIRGSAR